MKIVPNGLRRAWRWWCSIWQLRWEDMTRIDYHKWESRMEIHQRLSEPHCNSQMK
jgi:hypothetical protein